MREIASGGFGTVFLTKVMHADGFSRLVAVKLLKRQWTESEEVARRMRDEARLLGLLRHRHIVDVIDLTAIDGRAAVVMEYLDAIDLKQVLHRTISRGSNIPVVAVLEVGAAIASALDAAYNRPPMPGEKPLRVIHRDIKPSNVMLDETGMVKVLDFGVARSEIDTRESNTQDLQFGSVDYMAPERLFFEPETPASDVYSLGATIYELLAGEKLGKAKGRPAAHANMIRERLDAIAGRLQEVGARASAVRMLLEESLRYEHEARPGAAEFYRRARSISRAVGTGDLGGWSEEHLPQMIRAVRDLQSQPNPLDDAILTEDSLVFEQDDGGTQTMPVDGTKVDELRRGALAELDESGTMKIRPATGSPRRRAPRAEDDPTTVAVVPGSLPGPPTEALTDETVVSGSSSAASAPPPASPVSGRVNPVRPPSAPPPAAGARARFAPVRSGSGSVRRPAASSGSPVQNKAGGGAGASARGAAGTAAATAGGRANQTAQLDELTRSDDSLPQNDGEFAHTEPVVSVGDDVASKSVGGTELGAGAPLAASAVSPQRRGREGRGHSERDGASTERALRQRRYRSLLVGFVLGASGSLGVVVLLGLGWLVTDRDVAPAAVPAAVSRAEVQVPASVRTVVSTDVGADAAGAGGIVFTSAERGTRKLKVRCGSTSAGGKDSARVDLKSAASCTVTAYLPDRSRRTAAVRDVTEGAYVCFDVSRDICERR